MDTDLLKQSLFCHCPKCKKGRIFPHIWTLTTIKQCPHCDLDISDHDSGDGPAVFLIFILGFLLTPLALFVEYFTPIPLWGHAVLWTIASLAICLFTMQPLKTYVIALSYKHRGGAKGV
jgi:uncharacterized protein (DUF983 family)